jgi:hypothetical protein
MKSQLHAFFIFSIDEGYVFRLRLTVTTGNIWGWGGGLSASATYLIATPEASTTHLLLWPSDTHRYLISISKASTAVATATAIQYTLINHSQAA